MTNQECVQQILSRLDEEELMGLIGASYQTVRNWKSGRTNPRFPHSSRIMKLLPLVQKNLL